MLRRRHIADVLEASIPCFLDPTVPKDTPSSCDGTKTIHHNCSGFLYVEYLNALKLGAPVMMPTLSWLKCTLHSMTWVFFLETGTLMVTSLETFVGKVT